MKVTVNHLWQLYEELNHAYFENSVHVAELKLGKFLMDAFNGSITWGQFRNDSDGHNVIIVNAYLMYPMIIDVYPWMVEAVLYHEMVHAFLVLNKFPHRFGMYKCDDHGPEFYKVMNRHPNAKEVERILQGKHSVVDATMSEIVSDAREWVDKNEKRLLGRT